MLKSYTTKLLYTFLLLGLIACGKEAIEDTVITPPAPRATTTRIENSNESSEGVDVNGDGDLLDVIQRSVTITGANTTNGPWSVTNNVTILNFFERNAGKWLSSSVEEFEGYDNTTEVYDQSEEFGLYIFGTNGMGTYYFAEAQCGAPYGGTITTNTSSTLVLYDAYTNSDGLQEDRVTATRVGDTITIVLEDLDDGFIEFRSTRVFSVTDLDFNYACENYHEAFNIEVEDPTDTAAYGQWSDWSQWSGTASSAQETVEQTRTRTRECSVTVNGEADDPPPLCEGNQSESETRTIDNPNYVAPIVDVDYNEVNGIYSSNWSGGPTWYVVITNGQTSNWYTWNAGGNRVSTTANWSGHAFFVENGQLKVRFANGLVNVLTQVSEVPCEWTGCGAAPDPNPAEYVVNKRFINHSNNTTSYALVLNTGEDVCVDESYFTNFEYVSSSGQLLYATIDSSRVVTCQAGVNPNQWHDDLLALGWIRGSGNWDTGRGFYHANPNHPNWTVLTTDNGQTFAVGISRYDYVTTVSEVSEIANVINAFAIPIGPITYTYTVERDIPIDANDASQGTYTRFTISLSNPTGRVFTVRARAACQGSADYSIRHNVFSIGGGNHTSDRTFGYDVSPNYGLDFTHSYSLLQGSPTRWNIEIDGDTYCIGGWESTSGTIN